MRKIMFRGKELDNGDWVKGYLFALEEGVFIHSDGYWRAVDPHTIGEFTGYKDKNGNEVWEGDVFQNDGGYAHSEKYTVEFEDGMFVLVENGESAELADTLWNYAGKSWFEVIGNAWDSPELLTTCIYFHPTLLGSNKAELCQLHGKARCDCHGTREMCSFPES